MENNIKELCQRVNIALENAPDPKNPHDAQMFLRELTIILASLPHLIAGAKKDYLNEKRLLMKSEEFKQYKNDFGNALAAKFLETLAPDKYYDIVILEETYRIISKGCDSYRSILSFEKEEMRFQNV